LILTVSDDGRGFEMSRKAASLGLNGIRERAGIIGAHVEIKSEPGKGAEIVLSMVIPGPEENDRKDSNTYC
jgi:signal transduction histidine kinase